MTLFKKIISNVRYSWPSLYPSLALFFILSLYILFITPHWMTNDDVGISMRAHGYGGFYQASNYLIFSNYIWGIFVSMAPSFKNIPGYTFSCYLVLFISAITINAYLKRKSKSNFFSIFLTMTLFAIPLSLPQFTITSGVCAIAGLISYLSYADSKKNIHLFLFFILCYISFLIRVQEFFFLTLIFFPLFLKKKIFSKLSLIHFFIFFLLLVFSHFFNESKKNDKDWEIHNEINKTRITYMDYGYKYKGNLPIKNITANDQKLLQKWIFFSIGREGWKNIKNYLSKESNKITKNIFSFKKLETKKILNNFLIFHNLNGFDNPLILLYCLTIFLFFISNNKLKLSLSIAIFILVIFMFAGLRNLPFRVLYPFIFGLTIFSINNPINILNLKYIHIIINLIILVILATLTKTLYFKSINTDIYLKKINNDIDKISTDTLYLNGLPFDLTLLYPPFNSNYLKDFKFYALGSTVYSPLSYAYYYDFKLKQNNIHTHFLSEKGINMIWTNKYRKKNFYKELFSGYCKEKFNKQFSQKSLLNLETISVYNLKCY